MTMRRFPIGLWLSAAPVLAALIALGIWQVHRLEWKEALLAEIQARIASSPRTLDDVVRSEDDRDYWPVTVTGSFLHSAERHFFATYEGETGFYVYTPLDRGGRDYVFVNRGFVPYDRKDAATRAEGQVEGVVTITGLARNVLAEKPGSFVPDNDPAGNIFYWKDLRAMAASAGLPADAKVLGVFVDAGPAPNPGGLPVGGVTIVDMPNNHLQYVVTWFGLAAVLVVIVGVMTARRLGSGEA